MVSSYTFVSFFMTLYHVYRSWFIMCPIINWFLIFNWYVLKPLQALVQTEDVIQDRII
jgi:hypothetical protein